MPPPPAALVAPPGPALDYHARVRQQDLKLAADRFKKFFRMRATEFIRGKGSLAVVNDPICMGCTHCFDNCAFEAIDMVDRKFTLPELTYTSRKAVIITENCVGCEKCAIVCPVDAITMIPKDGWDVRDGRLVQLEPPPSVEKPYWQPPKPGEPRPPGEAELFVTFREEEKKAPTPVAASAAPPPTPATAAPAAPPAAPTPAAAPVAPSPPKPAARALSPEEIKRIREEARKTAQAGGKGGAKATAPAPQPAAQPVPQRVTPPPTPAAPPPAPPRPEAPKPAAAAPASPPPAPPPQKALTPEEIKRIREEARKKALAAKEGG